MANMFHIKKKNVTALASPLKIYYHTSYTKTQNYMALTLQVCTHMPLLLTCRKMEWPATSVFKLSPIKIYLSTGERKLPTNFTSMSSSESRLHFTQFIILTFIV